LSERPTSFTFAGKDWTIEWVDNDSSVISEGSIVYGDADPLTQKIRICTNGHHPDVVRDTLFHEVKHAVNFVADLSNGSTEEEFVTRSTPMELEVLRNNEDLTMFLLAD
tara:strand:- start:5123 stop:5449 length:327 start_codon:yes stop_codon:yes gene_type:complete